MNSVRPLWLAAALWLPLLVVGCDGEAELPATPEPDMLIGLVWPDDPAAGQLVEGVELAIEEINAGGGALGRQLATVRISDLGDGSNDAGTAIARRLIDTPNLVAIIGHRHAEAALMASVAYDRAGVLYFNVAITDQSITKGGFAHVFSLVGSNDRLGQQLATLADGLGHQKVALLASREDWAFQVAGAFDQEAAVLGIEIPVRRSFHPQKSSYIDVIAELGAAEFDAIMVIAEQPAFVAIASQSHSMRIEKPLLAGAMLDPSLVNELLDGQSDTLVFPVLLDPDSSLEAVTAFREAFRSRYGREPDSIAAQGYDAIHLLAETMSEAGSSEPLSVATLLHFSTAWTGVTGRHSFDLLGRIYTKPFSFAVLQQGLLEYLGDGA